MGSIENIRVERIVAKDVRHFTCLFEEVTEQERGKNNLEKGVYRI